MTSAVLEVISPGLMSTIQDFGRFGHQAQGMPTSGALDPGNMRLANGLVGNDDGLGVLEIRILGPVFRVGAETVRLALTGTESCLEIDAPQKRTVDANRSVTLKRGDVFRIGRVADSAVCYLAVEGGFDVAPLYGSQSTYVSGALGGFEGRVLQAGDKLPLCKERAIEGSEMICASPLQYSSSAPVRVVPGPQADYFSEEGTAVFFSSEYQFSADSNRMGVRLQGPDIVHSKGSDINSDGIVTGSIQVPGNGQPIVLLADHQTTGGYPKIGTVISADLARLGRMEPGAKVRFVAVDVSEGEAARRELEKAIVASIASIRQLPNADEELGYWLIHKNLISGVVAD